MFASALSALILGTTLIQGGTVIDGHGGPRYEADVRFAGDRIVAVGQLEPILGERVIRARGMVICPGFIDSHSHADGGIAKEPTALSQVTQGVTTSVVGQDGGWSKPVAERLKELESANPAINFAMFSGEGGIRGKVMGKDFERPATPAEIEKMDDLVEQDMKAGALGVSTGLEYDPGHYSTTEELISLCKVAAKYHGMYISHVRDEGNGALDSFKELIRIAREANCPAQISHIKLATFAVWNRANEAITLFNQARTEGLDISADIYPYLYWQSSITAMTVSREFDKPETWKRALDETGGGKNVLLTRYSPKPTWQGKTVAEIAQAQSKTETEIVNEIVKKTHFPGSKEEESVVVTAMTDADMLAFVKWPNTMFCSDGSIGGTHPRGAGSFPRALANFAQPAGPLRMEEVVRKMTSLPAQRFQLKDRGELRPGAFADIVIFDPKHIIDRATPKNPTALSEGVIDVFVNGVEVLSGGKAAGRGGRALKRAS